MSSAELFVSNLDMGVEVHVGQVRQEIFAHHPVELLLVREAVVDF
jgi:hypothetical protein